MEGGFHAAAWMRVDGKESLWPARWSWLAVYAVTGASEGHYVHIDLIGCPGDNQVEHMALVKTFSGWEKASLIAPAACRERNSGMSSVNRSRWLTARFRTALSASWGPTLPVPSSGWQPAVRCHW